MKSFFGIVKRRNNDRSGNPRDLLSLYRIKRNKPELVAADIHIGYRADWQAAIEYLKGCGELSKNSLNCVPGLRHSGVADITIISV